jgi:hypothetical protein
MSNERYLEVSEELVEMQTADALRKTQAAATQRQCDGPLGADFDGEHCIDCDIELPQVRLNYGYVRCTHCQEAADRAAKRRG